MVTVPIGSFQAMTGDVAFIVQFYDTVSVRFPASKDFQYMFPPTSYAGIQVRDPSVE